MKRSRTTQTKQSFSVELTIRQFLRVEAKDERDKVTYGLMTLLEELGCFEIEYNGHFGPNIYYSLYSEDVSENKLSLIEKLIVNYSESKVS